MKRSKWQPGVFARALAIGVALCASIRCPAQDAPPPPPDAPPETPADTPAEDQPTVSDPILEPLNGLELKQPPRPGKNSYPSDPIVTIDWGFGASIPALRYVPVKITLDGGLEAFSGVITFRYRADTTQSMVVTVPVAATPNKKSVYTPIIAYPAPGDKIDVVLAERSGRAVMRCTYAPSPGTDEIQLPPVRPDADPLVVAIGPRQSGAASATVMRLSSIPSRLNPAVPLALDAVLVDPGTLPTLPGAYDAVNAVVVQCDAVRSMDERAAAALREWVLAGGWLVVVATSADETWASWLPPQSVSGPGALLRVAEPTGEPMPPALARLVTTEVVVDQALLTGRFSTQTWAAWRDSPQWMLGPTVGESLQKPDPPAPPPTPEPTPVDAVVTPASQITARWIKLTQAGRNAGWSLSVSKSDAPPASEFGPPASLAGADGDQGLIAQGPVGFGWVTIVGFDPRRVTAEVSNKGPQRVWADVFGLNMRIRPPGEPIPRVLRGPPPPLLNGYWYSGVNDSGLGLALALDAVASSQAPGRSVFLLVALAAGMVPLLIGPVDYLLLRRSKSAHRSWLTALGWISLASLAAWLAPLYLRASTTTVSRLCAVDVMMPATEGAGEPLAVQTAITGVFAANSISATLAGLPDRATVRGIAGDMGVMNFDEATRHGGELPIAQASPGIEAAATDADSWGGFAPQTSSAETFGDRVLETTWRLWTFRAVEDRARVRPTVTATIEPAASAGGGVRVRVKGLPPGAVISRGAVVTRGVWEELTSGAAVEPTPDGAVLSVAGAGERAFWEPRPTVRVDSGYTFFETRVGPTLGLAPGAALTLRGAGARGDTLESFIESGAWDAVYLHVTGLPSSVSLDDSTKNSEQAVYRIVIPRATTRAGAPTEASQDRTR